MASARKSSSWCAPRARCTRIADRADARTSASFFDHVDRDDPEYDTEQIYFELLREIGRSVELRVVVDIIAGASAGGINGTMLARALSHDLPMDALRRLWLENADVSVLLSADARAGTWSKWFLTPFIWARLEDRQVPRRSRTSRCARSSRCSCARAGSSRRSTARIMAALMYDAVTAMGAPKQRRARRCCPPAIRSTCS